MKKANDIWKLARDIMLVVTGVICLLLIATGVTPPQVAPLLVPVAGGLCAAPVYLRKDERNGRGK